MKAGLLFLLFVCVIAVSCRNSHSGGVTDKCGACPLYAAAEILPTIRVRIVDKVSGADLFLLPTSPYKLSDLKVTSSLNDSVRFGVDSTVTDNRAIWLPSPQSQTFTFKLASLSSDSIKVVLARDSPVCCPRTRIKSITLDNVQQCSPCSFGQLVTIKK